MPDLFYLKLLLAFGVGSFMVTLATVAAERLGSKTGGLIGGLPTMVSITLFFIGLVQTPRIASEATNVIPLVMGFNGLFLVIYAMLAKWSASIGLAGALLTWIFLSSLVVLLDVQSFVFSLLVFVLLLVFSYTILEKKLSLRSTGKLSIRYTPLQIASRALFSGTIVASGVYLSKIGGPIWGGIIAPFPTAYLSTLIIMANSKGLEYSRMITKSLLISGMINVVVYTIAVRYFYLLFGLALGTILALSVSAGSAYGTYVFMKERMT